jgi:hypothetical protein
LVRVLDGQDIVHPAPTTGSIHAIRVILSFVEIAAEELKPKYMRGYGEVADSMMPELNGIANEIQPSVPTAAKSRRIKWRALSFGLRP